MHSTSRETGWWVLELAVPHTSSARRLYNIVAHVSDHAQGNHHAWQAWAIAVQDATVAESTSLTKRDFFSTLPKLWNLVSQVKTDMMDHYGEDASPLMHAVVSVESLLSPSELIKPVGNLKERIDRDRVVWGLDSLAYELDRTAREDGLSTEALISTIEAVSKAMRDISSDDSVDKDFRTFLIYHLGEVHSALVHYRISGPGCVASKVQQATGAIVLSERTRDAGIRGSSAVRRAVDELGNVNKLLEESKKLVLGGKMIVGLFSKFLS